jgi:hypothetical protein
MATGVCNVATVAAGFDGTDTEANITEADAVTIVGCSRRHEIQTRGLSGQFVRFVRAQPNRYRTAGQRRHGRESEVAESYR